VALAPAPSPRRDQLGHPQTAGVGQAQQRPVPRVGLQGEQAVDLDLGEDALGEGVLELGQPQSAADVEGEVAQPVAERQQRFDGRPRPRLRGQAKRGRGIGEGRGEGLHVAQRDLPEGLPSQGGVGEEAVGLPAVRPLRVGAAPEQPQLE
jgi:hypothetical protein